MSKPVKYGLLFALSIITTWLVGILAATIVGPIGYALSFIFGVVTGWMSMEYMLNENR